MMAMGKDSPAQMIQRSEDMRSAFNGILKIRLPCAKVKNLRAAKHRFESFQKPLGRSIRLFRPIHSLMVQVATRGRTEVRKKAKAWLAWLSPGKIIQCAMLADAADEGMALTRYCDREDMAVAEMPTQVMTFLDRITHLFGANRACLNCVGYTATALELLREPIVWVVGASEPCSLRPPTDAEIDACFNHMGGFLKLALLEVQAEFPDWEVAQAFSIFNLSREISMDAMQSDPEFTKKAGGWYKHAGVVAWKPSQPSSSATNLTQDGSGRSFSVAHRQLGC